MEKSGSFKDLIVWKKSIQVTTRIYHMTKNFPRDEMYGLISQIRRESVSIAANISEGQARNSVGELETLLIISENVGYIEKEENDTCTKEIHKKSLN